MTLVPSAIASGQSPSPKNQEALKILEKAGVKGGLVVHLGCGDGSLFAADNQLSLSLRDGSVMAMEAGI